MIEQQATPGTSQTVTVQDRRFFLQLPLEERRRRLAEQANDVLKHYHEPVEQAERQDWQTGDIAEY